ncbi:MAG: integrase arm-type DNA-binding domain-containing protein, partial [Pseudomonadota bacterium]|nr:integrase arm-type DNA-binding domain-containing protein [Pseudomonadota bacterium]
MSDPGQIGRSFPVQDAPQPSIDSRGQVGATFCQVAPNDDGVAPMPLTAKTIDNAKPRATPTRLWDAGGLYVEISPSGGKWWRWKYRFEGKEKRVSFGTYDDVSIRAARDKRDEARKLLKDGIDPSVQRQTEKHQKQQAAANSFEAVAREWYGKQSTLWTAKHAADVLRRLESNLFPELGDLPISEITAPALLTAVRAIESRGAHDL